MFFYCLFFSLIACCREQHVNATLPFSRSEASREDYDPVVLSFTEKEVKRCIEAIDWYIESFAPEMEKRGLDKEIVRYEDLLYRFMGVPGNDKEHAEGRKEDRRG